MKELGFHQIEPPLDALHSLVKSVHAPMYSGDSFFDMRGADFQVLHIIDKAIHPLFHSRQARLDLLQHRDDDVGDFTHSLKCICSCDVPQDATEFR
jgi:hypothetical protein